MPDMKIVTTYVHPDEGCWGMYEGPRAGRWVTALYVIRGDAIAEYLEDHGPEEDFARIPPLMAPSFGENCVAAMLEGAAEHRHDLHWWKRAEEMKAESTLIKDVIEQEKQRLLWLRNKSVIGPYQTTQRNGYSRAEAWRRFQDKRERVRA